MRATHPGWHLNASRERQQWVETPNGSAAEPQRGLRDSRTQDIDAPRPEQKRLQR